MLNFGEEKFHHGPNKILLEFTMFMGRKPEEIENESFFHR